MNASAQTPSRVCLSWEARQRSTPIAENTRPVGLAGPDGGVAEWFRQGPAKPRTRVRFPAPPLFNSWVIKANQEFPAEIRRAVDLSWSRSWSRPFKGGRSL